MFISRVFGEYKMKKIIKIKFVDYWKKFNPKQHIIYERLSKYFDVQLSDKPDYIVYGPFGEEHLKYIDCIKIFYTGECIAPDFNLCDYAIGYEYINFQDRYFRLPDYYNPTYRADLYLCEKKHEIYKQYMQDKTDFCSFVYSNGDGDKARIEIFEKLSEYKKVLSGGRLLNNINQPKGVKDKLAFQRKFKFSIACENGKHYGYTTEKIVQSFAACTIPIYWGDPSVYETFNKKAFINASDFKTLDDLVKYVEFVDNNEDIYLTMLKEPAVINTDALCDNLLIEFDRYLVSIFSQPQGKAYRRNMVFWGAKYQRKRLDEYMMQSNADKGNCRKIYDVMKRLFPFCNRG